MHSQTAPDSLLLPVWAQDCVHSLHDGVGFESGTETSRTIAFKMVSNEGSTLRTQLQI